MRDLGRPETLRNAMIAAGATTLAALPRLLIWPEGHFAVWYFAAILFLGGTVLWGFVFAWHSKYSHRPVIVLRIDFATFAFATIAGIACAAALWLFIDSDLRKTMPDEYPADFHQWLAMALFTLGFNQMFLIFAPLAWLLRLLHSRIIAATLTVLFGVAVVAMKAKASPIPFPLPLLLADLLIRAVMAVLLVLCYLRGGVFLSWWFGFLVEARTLFMLAW